MQPLNRNHGGYFGETIRIEGVLEADLAAARAHGWTSEQLIAAADLTLLAFKRSARRAPGARPAPRIYLSTGIHGDEPAGPLAVCQLLQRDAWPEGLDLWVCPCLNPTGFAGNRRENSQGIDLNRQYLHLQAAETRAHVAWLRAQATFDLTLCLHEDWEARGFYLYELNLDGRPSLAEAIIRRVADVCPIDPSTEIEGRPAENGIIRPSADPRSRPQWPEAFYLITHKTRLSYTLEAPSDFPLATRVAALVTAVRAALERF
jgi:Succinylglutamate desuccinylase / Aspartoacylase family